MLEELVIGFMPPPPIPRPKSVPANSDMHIALGPPMSLTPFEVDGNRTADLAASPRRGGEERVLRRCGSDYPEGFPNTSDLAKSRWLY